MWAQILLHAGQAGTDVRCDCGTVLRVPPLGELRQLEKEQPAASPEAKAAPDALPAERKPAPQAHVLTGAVEYRRRMRVESLEHYIHAVMRTIEECLARLPETTGMDFRTAVAIMPEGQPLVDVEFRPDLPVPAVVDDIQHRIESLPRPPVREGPVAFLAFWLVRGGSNDLHNSFRHRYGPYFRLECPGIMAAALNDAEAASAPRPPTRWQRLSQKAGHLASKFRTALRRVWSATLSARASSAPGAATKQGNDHQHHWSLDDITRQIRLDPGSGKLYGWRAEIYRSQGQFDLAIADYTRQIDLASEVPQAHLARGVCYRTTGDQEKALADFNEAVRRRPQWTEAIIARAWTHFALGKAERALDDAALAVELEPEEPKWLLARARLLATAGTFDKAMADLKHAPPA